MRNKRVLITGGSGSIGSELVRQLSKFNKVFILDIDETRTYDLIEFSKNIYGRVGSVCDKETVEDVFDEFEPQIVFHAAAYKHVTPMEWYPIEAIKTNILGTYNVMKIAQKHKVEKFVFISTDKVNSDSVMGATKRVGEKIVKNRGKGFIVVRFGNVLGSRGSVIPIWQRQIDAGKPVTITDPNMERFFMTIEEACDLVIKASEMGEGGEIIILDMGSRVKILDLAKKIIDQSGRNIPIKMIGRRPGEILVEEIMSEEEKKVAVKKGRFYIIK